MKVFLDICLSLFYPSMDIVNLRIFLRKALLIDKFSPLDLLEYYSKVYKMNFDGQGLISEVPKKVHDLDKALGLKLFPK